MGTGPVGTGPVGTGPVGTGPVGQASLPVYKLTGRNACPTDNTAGRDACPTGASPVLRTGREVVAYPEANRKENRSEKPGLA